MFDTKWNEMATFTYYSEQLVLIFVNSTIIFSCGLHVNIFYVKYLIQVSAK